MEGQSEICQGAGIPEFIIIQIFLTHHTAILLYLRFTKTKKINEE